MLMLHLSTCSRPNWMRFGATWSGERWTCVWQRLGTRWFLRSLLTQTIACSMILWFSSLRIYGHAHSKLIFSDNCVLFCFTVLLKQYSAGCASKSHVCKCNIELYWAVSLVLLVLSTSFTVACSVLYEWHAQNQNFVFDQKQFDQNQIAQNLGHHPARCVSMMSVFEDCHPQWYKSLTRSCRESLLGTAKSMSFPLELKASYFSLEVEKWKWCVGWGSSPNGWVYIKGVVWKLATHNLNTFLLPLMGPLAPWGIAVWWDPEHVRDAESCLSQEWKLENPLSKCEMMQGKDVSAQGLKCWKSTVQRQTGNTLLW